MFASYLKIFCQKLIAHKVFSLINIGGLAIGLACCLIIVLFIEHELSYEQDFANAENIYLIGQALPSAPGENSGFSSKLLAPLLKEEFQEFKQLARFVFFPTASEVKSDSAEGVESSIRYTEPAFFDIFDYKWIVGSAESALQAGDDIVLTREMAEKYFGSADVLGRTLTLNGDVTVRVSGVIETDDKQSTLDFSALMSIDFYEKYNTPPGFDFNGWYVMFVQTFALIEDDANIGLMTRRFPDFVTRHIEEQVQGSEITGLEMLPFTDLYLKRSFQQSEAGMSNLQRVKLFAAIGFSILLIAIFNFMNLSTSRSSTRSMEVGLRMAMGSSRRDLIWMFLLEAIGMTLLAMMFALAFVEFILPLASIFFGFELSLGQIHPGWGFILLVLSCIVVGILAGIYPACYLSKAEPVSILRGEVSRGKSGLWFRNILVVCQFSLSIALIVVALIMAGQISYMKDLDLGFNSNRVAVITLPRREHFNIAQQWDSLESALLDVAGVEEVTHGIDTPLMNLRLMTNIAKDDGVEDVTISLYPSAADYLPFYGIDLIAGRYFDEDLESDRLRIQDPDRVGSPNGGVILNAAAVRVMGWTLDESLGKNFRLPRQEGIINGTVIGIVENTISSVQDDPFPIVYYLPIGGGYAVYNGAISIKIDENQLEGISARLTQAWTAYFPDLQVNLMFLESRLAAQYQNEQRQMEFFGFTALLTVFIACFGLFGLASFNAERRRKEVGIRKAVGGPVWKIVLMLTKDFSKLVLLANVIAWPMAYYVMEKWLQNFVYQIELSPMIFIGSGLMALGTAWFTVGGIAAKAALQKPVLALRYE